MAASRHLRTGATLSQRGGYSARWCHLALLANIALHGLETAIKAIPPRKRAANVIRYADDFVILHPDRQHLAKIRSVVEAWLAEMGLRLKAAKTRVAHTRDEHGGEAPGFEFLGFTIRQFVVGKYQSKRGYKTIIKPSQKSVQRHLAQIDEWIRSQKDGAQHTLLLMLNPRIKGWTRYFSPQCAGKTFNQMDELLYRKLWRWARRRHPKQGKGYAYRRYWQRRQGHMRFSDGLLTLVHYSDTPIRRHIKVRDTKSPFDGDWPYWATRLGRDPLRPQRIATLLKRQHGKCHHCGQWFRQTDLMEVHHADGDRSNNRYENLRLLHRHCHDQLHRQLRLLGDFATARLCP